MQARSFDAMSQVEHRYYILSDEVTSRFSLDATPFPVRSQVADSVFKADAVSLDALLDELADFVTAHPHCAEAYRANAESLTLICATNNIAANDFMAALANLNAGLRIVPQHRGMKVHQALTLQVNGYTEAAAMEYERLLWDAPQAFDPLIRALAAKAFSSIGDNEKALDILELLPEPAFLDPALARLRASLRGHPTSPNPRSNRETQQTEAVCVKKSFCTQCGNKLKPRGAFCTACGARL